MRSGNYLTLTNRLRPRNEYVRITHYACDSVDDIARKTYVKEKDEIDCELKGNLNLLINMIDNAKKLLLARAKVKNDNVSVLTEEAVKLVSTTEHFKAKFPKCVKSPSCVELVLNIYKYAILPDRKEEEETIHE